MKDAIPELVQEVEKLLAEVGESALVEQVSALRIVDRCRCGVKDCATMYIAPRPADGWPSPHRNIMLPCATGYLILDVVAERIVCVEVLGRRNVRRKLDKLLPLETIETRDTQQS